MAIFSCFLCVELHRIDNFIVLFCWWIICETIREFALKNRQKCKYVNIYRCDANTPCVCVFGGSVEVCARGFQFSNLIFHWKCIRWLQKLEIEADIKERDTSPMRWLVYVAVSVTAVMPHDSFEMFRFLSQSSAVHTNSRTAQKRNNSTNINETIPFYLLNVEVK